MVLYSPITPTHTQMFTKRGLMVTRFHGGHGWHHGNTSATRPRGITHRITLVCSSLERLLRDLGNLEGVHGIPFRHNGSVSLHTHAHTHTITYYHKHSIMHTISHTDIKHLLLRAHIVHRVRVEDT